MPRILVVGLSSLGEGLVRHLVRRDARVLAVDKKRTRMEQVARLPGCRAGCLDATDPASLQEYLGDRTVEAAVVAIGRDFLAAEHVAEVLARLRVGGGRQVERVHVVAHSEHRARIFEVLGHGVFKPILHAAASLAVRITQPGLVHFHRLGTDHEGNAYGTGELVVPRAASALSVADIESEVFGLRYLAVRKEPRGPLHAPLVRVDGGWSLWLAGPAPAFDRAWRLLADRTRDDAPA